MRFSVLLPTKDRLNLLQYAVESVLCQTYLEWELIVVDNFSEEDIKGYISSLDDARIRYYRQKEAVSLADNWNTALKHASGDYIIMLGDDDALVPEALSILKERIDRYSPDVLCYKSLVYLNPEVDSSQSGGDVYLGLPLAVGDISKDAILPKSWRIATVRDCLDFKIEKVGYNAQYYCVSKEMIAKLRKKGAYYEPVWPDYYAACMLLLYAEKFVFVAELLVVIGITSKSFGYYARNKKEKAGMEMFKEGDFREKAPEAIRGKLCSFDEMRTGAAATFALVEQRNEQGIKVNIFGYYKDILNRAARYLSVEELNNIINAEIACNVNQEELLELRKLAKEATQKKLPDIVKKKPALSYANMRELMRNICDIKSKVEENRHEDIDRWMNKEMLDVLGVLSETKDIYIWGYYERSDYLSRILQKNGIKVKGYLETMVEKREFRENNVCGIERINSECTIVLVPLLHIYDDVIKSLEKKGYHDKESYFYIAKE